MTLTAVANVPVADPRRLMEAVSEHLAEHGTPLPPEPDRRGIAFPFGQVALSIAPTGLELRAEAADLEGLLTARFALTSHLLEFAEGDAPAIVWSGDGSDIVRPPNYREITVTAVEDVTPHMRRIHFSGDDLGRFADIGNMHVRLTFPAPGEAMPVPRLGPNGMPGWPEGAARPVERKYTIRTIDVARGRFAIDFVLHDVPGPGSSFAKTARPGQRIGMAGPGGRGLVAADWHVFIADETGLPAVARMLESLPAEARGIAIIEVADAGERQDLRHPPGIRLDWRLRAANPPALIDQVRAVALPAEGSVRVWAAVEFDDFKRLRSHVRDTLGLSGDQQLVVSYWRRGHD